MAQINKCIDLENQRGNQKGENALVSNSVAVVQVLFKVTLFLFGMYCAAAYLSTHWAIQIVEIEPRGGDMRRT